MAYGDMVKIGGGVETLGTASGNKTIPGNPDGNTGLQLASFTLTKGVWLLDIYFYGATGNTNDVWHYIQKGNDPLVFQLNNGRLSPGSNITQFHAPCLINVDNDGVYTYTLYHSKGNTNANTLTIYSFVIQGIKLFSS